MLLNHVCPCVIETSVWIVIVFFYDEEIRSRFDSFDVSIGGHMESVCNGSLLRFVCPHSYSFIFGTKVEEWFCWYHRTEMSWADMNGYSSFEPIPPCINGIWRISRSWIYRLVSMPSNRKTRRLSLLGTIYMTDCTSYLWELGGCIAMTCIGERLWEERMIFQLARRRYALCTHHFGGWGGRAMKITALCWHVPRQTHFIPSPSLKRAPIP